MVRNAGSKKGKIGVPIAFRLDVDSIDVNGNKVSGVWVPLFMKNVLSIV